MHCTRRVWDFVFASSGCNRICIDLFLYALCSCACVALKIQSLRPHPPRSCVASHSLARQADEIGGYDAQETLEFVKTLASHPLWCRDAIVQCSPCTIITRHCRYKNHPDREKNSQGWGGRPPEPNKSSLVCIVSAHRRPQRALITLAPAQMATGGHRGWRHRIWTAGPLAAPRHAGEPRAANAAAPQTLVSAPSSWHDEYVSSPTNARIHIQFIAAL